MGATVRVPLVRRTVGGRHDRPRREGHGGTSRREGDGASGIEITSNHKIVTEHYKLHVLHVFTVDSLHSVQTLGRAVFHSKGHSEISSIQIHIDAFSPFLQIVHACIQSFRERFPLSASISLACGGWIRAITHRIQKIRSFFVSPTISFDTPTLP